MGTAAHTEHLVLGAPRPSWHGSNSEVSILLLNLLYDGNIIVYYSISMLAIVTILQIKVLIIVS